MYGIQSGVHAVVIINFLAGMKWLFLFHPWQSVGARGGREPVFCKVFADDVKQGHPDGRKQGGGVNQDSTTVGFILIHIL